MLKKLLSLAVLWSGAMAGQRTVFQAKTGRVLGEVDDYDLSLMVFLKDIELTPKATKSLHIAESGKRYEMSLGTSRFGHIQSSLLLVDKEQPNGEPSGDTQQVCSLEAKSTDFDMLLGNFFSDGKKLLATASWKATNLLLFDDGQLNRLEIKVDQAMNDKHAPDGRYPESIHSVSTALFGNLRSNLATLFAKDPSFVNLNSVGLYPVDESTGEVLLICNLGMASFLSTLDKPTLSKINSPGAYDFNIVKKSDVVNGLIFLMLHSNAIEIRSLVNFELKMLVDSSYLPAGVVASAFMDFEAQKSRMVIGASNDSIKCFGDMADCLSLIEYEFPSGSIAEKFSDIILHGPNLLFVLTENGLYFLNLQSILDSPATSSSWPTKFSKHFARIENGQKIVRHMNGLYVARAAPAETSNLYTVEEYVLKDSSASLWEQEPAGSVIGFRKAYFVNQPILALSADDEFLFIHSQGMTKMYRTGVHPLFERSIPQDSHTRLETGVFAYNKVYINDRGFITQVGDNHWMFLSPPREESRLVCSLLNTTVGVYQYSLNTTVANCPQSIGNVYFASSSQYSSCRFRQTFVIRSHIDSFTDDLAHVFEESLPLWQAYYIIVFLFLLAATVSCCYYLKSVEIKNIEKELAQRMKQASTPTREDQVLMSQRTLEDQGNEKPNELKIMGEKSKLNKSKLSLKDDTMPDDSMEYDQEEDAKENDDREEEREDNEDEEDMDEGVDTEEKGTGGPSDK